MGRLRKGREGEQRKKGSEAENGYFRIWEGCRMEIGKGNGLGCEEKRVLKVTFVMAFKRSN